MAGKRKRIPKGTSNTTEATETAQQQEQQPVQKRKRATKAPSTATEEQEADEQQEEQPAYSSKEYWDSRYKDKVSHEWYFGYSDLKALFDQFLDRAGDCLDIGCGDKPMVRMQSPRCCPGRSGFINAVIASCWHVGA